MSDLPLPKPGVVHLTETGVRMWRPNFTELQVCRVVEGSAVTTVITVTDREGVCEMFQLSPDQARDLALRIYPDLIGVELQDVRDAA